MSRKQNPLREWKVVGLLLAGWSNKAVARRYGLSVSTVAKIKAKHPLFFWKTKKRYIK